MTTEQVDVKARITFSRGAKKMVGRALNNGLASQVIEGVVDSAVESIRSQHRAQLTRDDLRLFFEEEFNSRIVHPLDSEILGLRGFDFSRRKPERSEIFTEEEAQTYIDGCDYPESADDLLLALEVQRAFTEEGIRRMSVLDAMCGPGRLGRELFKLGVESVVFHDGDRTMTAHARQQAVAILQPGQSIEVITSPVENIPQPDNQFDLVVCHNSTHQLSSRGRLRLAMQEFLRLTIPGGHIVIADYQRATTPDFLSSLEERLRNTRPEIVPLLVPTFMAAFSKGEFRHVLRSIPGINNWSVTDAQLPMLSHQMRERVAADPVKGHLMDYSPISLRVVIQKGQA